MKQQLFTTGDAVSAACAVNTKRRGRLLAMAAGILSVLILLVTAMQFVISAGADRYSEYSNSCRKYMMAFMKNDSTYSQLVNATRLPYRNYVESLQRDQGFLNSLTAWKAANLDLSGGVSEITQSAEYKYYLGILMDLMTDTVNETNLLDAADAYMDALHISLAKQSVNTLKKYNELSMKVDKEDSETLLNEIGMLEEASDVLDLIGDIGNVIEKANDFGDLIDKISQLCAIHDLTKGYSEVMRFMCDACDSDNIALKSALAYMRDVTSGALTEEMASAILTGQTVADDALKSVLGAVKKSVLSVMGYGGTVISFAQSLSKYVANQLFATDNIQSAFYKSRALYDIEDLLRLALKGTSSADRFFAAFSLYENVMYKGADYSVSYYKAVYEDSIFGKVFAWIQGNGDAASKFKSMMSDEKDRLKVSFDNLQRRAYNGYKGLAHTSEVGDLNVRQEYIIPDLSDLVENDAQLNKLSIETYGLPDEDYTLTEDMTLYANVYHSNGTIDLNGHSLTILGDLVLEGGCVKINGGQLNISGDYNAYKATANKDGTFAYSNGGYLSMDNAADKITVNGDFNTCYNYYYGILKLGIIEIKGNLNDYYDSDDYYGLYSDGTKFIFSGTGAQTITAKHECISIKEVDFVNTENRELVINCEIAANLCSDTYITGNAIVQGNLNGHLLNVGGNLTVNNSLSVNEGKIVVGKNLYNYGSVSLGGGTIEIAGDYNGYKSTTNKDGIIIYSNGGHLSMDNAADKITVNGDFNTCYNYYYGILKLGIIEIKGDLNDYYDSDNYYGLYSDGTKFIFSGTGKQTITATDGYIYFKNVDFVDTENRELVINCEISADLCSDTYIAGDAVIYNGNLNGHLLNVSGNLTVNNSLSVNEGKIVVGKNLYNYGSVSLGGGTIEIAGDYNAYKSTTNKDGTITYSAGGNLSMKNAVDKVTVNGDFNTCYNYNNSNYYLYDGTIIINGNLIDYYNDSSNYYGLYSYGTKFIFSGAGNQTITATDGYIKFENVDFVNTENRELVINCEIAANLSSDTYITGNAIVRGNLNGHLLNVSGNLTVNNSIDIAGGDIVVEGDLYNYGSISLSGGYLTVNGNYNAYKSTTNKDGTITYSNGGYLDMYNAVEKVTVNGDFNTCCDYSNHSHYLNKGTIVINGNLIDYYNDSSNYGLYSNGTKFIFSGAGKQTITATDGYIRFSDVDFVDTENRELVINCEISADLCSDTYITGDATVCGNLNGHLLNVSGNLTVNNSIDVAGGDIVVEGDLYNYGSISLNGGYLTLNGNYNAYKSTTNKDGTITYSEGGYLDTDSAVDKVIVSGDFNTCFNYYYSGTLCYGTIEIKGDLNDYFNNGSTNSDGVYSNGTKFIFNGTGTQIITALDGKLVLNTAEFVNKNVQIDCSTEIDVDVPVKVHDYSDEWTVDVEAACNDGSKSHHCTRCDAKTDITVIPGKGHTVVIDAAVAPSCTEPRLTEGSHCSVCNTVIKAQETVPATGHDFENGICKNCNMDEAMTIQSKHPYDNSCDETWTIHRDGATRIDVTFTDETYTESGYDYIYIYDGDDKLIGKYSGSELSGKTISVNSDTVKIRLTSDSSNTQYGFALDKVEYSMEAQCAHSNTEIRNAKSAGCTTEGYTGDTYCKDCGEKISSGEVIPAKGHTEVTDKAVAATCTKTGLTEGKHCSVCDAVIKAQEVVPAKGHTEVIDKAVEATCTKTGLTEGKHCSVCNAVIKAQETVPATGKHSFGDWKITKAATCTAEGTQTRTCSGCGKVETQTIAKTAHKYVNTVVKPTYTAKGYTLHKCSVCGESYKDIYTAKLTLAKVTGVKLGGRAADALRVNWTKNANASGYIVEMYQGNKWVRVAKITSNATTTYRASGLKASTVYKFRVRAYKMEGKAVAYGAYSTELAARTNPSVMTGVKLSGRAADALRINWSKNASADGYIVEMYQGNKWVRVAKIANSNTTTFRKAGLKASSVYKFRVRAYKMSGSTALYGSYSATVTARTNPSIVKGVKIGGKAKDALRVNWTKNASAQGYIVEMYKGGKWVRVAKITNGNTTTFRKAGLVKNTTYKFRVKAYYMSGKTALYGNYGSVSGKTAAK